MLPLTYQTPAAALLVVGGLVACFAGYRFFRIVLVLYGFIIGALVATSAIGAGGTTQLVVAAIVGGLIGGLIFYTAYFLGVALVGAAIGALIVHAVWVQIGTDPHPVVLILFAVSGAVAAMILQRYVIVVATSFGGAWTLVIGALALAGNERALKAAAGDVWVLYAFSLQPDDRGLLLVWLALGFLGLIVQLRFTGRGRSRANRWKAQTA
ncbi:MAG: TMEM198/TM7SF3 family protein [Acidobacteria bacterium]|nr:MAG: TMEM198/TM7SF3 family protein [Acidobacteriota bacterium]